LSRRDSHLSHVYMYIICSRRLCVIHALFARYVQLKSQAASGHFCPVRSMKTCLFAAATKQRLLLILGLHCVPRSRRPVHVKIRCRRCSVSFRIQQQRVVGRVERGIARKAALVRKLMLGPVHGDFNCSFLLF